MLHEFLTANRDAIKARIAHRELQFGVALFLTQLSETLRLHDTGNRYSETDIETAARKHGAELRALGCNVSQVVHSYGDICQAVTEMAVEERAEVTTEEFRILNRCLDVAIAGAVTEHARLTAEHRSTSEIERSGQIAHEVRDLLNTSLLAFHTLKRGTVAINGNTGTVLGRSLMNLRDLVDNTLSDIRMDADISKQERLSVKVFMSQIALAANLHAEFRALRFTIDDIDPELTVIADPQLLASAVMNLVNNAFKFTPAGGDVRLRAARGGEMLRIEVEDRCGGIPESSADPFLAFADRRQYDRSGLGLGLSIARKAVRIYGGDISFRNLPDVGCVFVIELPLATEAPFARPLPDQHQPETGDSAAARIPSE